MEENKLVDLRGIQISENEKHRLIDLERQIGF